jgi:hypothetical protein
VADDVAALDDVDVAEPPQVAEQGERGAARETGRRRELAVGLGRIGRHDLLEEAEYAVGAGHARITLGDASQARKLRFALDGGEAIE